jgi:hypothetical protein
MCPWFTTSKLALMEQKFLELIDYDVGVSSRLYTKYYFELRTLIDAQTIKYALHDCVLP